MTLVSAEGVDFDLAGRADTPVDFAQGQAWSAAFHDDFA